MNTQQKNCYTLHGTQSEDKTVARMQVDTIGVGSRLDKVDKFFNMRVLETKAFKFDIVGKIDCVETRADGTKVLVEIKNRVNKLFKTLREYEKIQVMTYLKMLSLTEGRLVEQYNAEMNSIEVSFDDEYYDSVILPGVVRFAVALDAILTDENARREFERHRTLQLDHAPC